MSTFGCKTKKEFIESFNFYLQKYGLIAIPINKDFKISNYESDRDALEFDIITLHDSNCNSSCYFVSASSYEKSLLCERFELALKLFKKSREFGDSVYMEYVFFGTDAYTVDDYNSYYLAELNNYNKEEKETMKKNTVNFEDLEDNDEESTEELYTEEKTGFIYTAKDLITTIVGIAHIAGSVFSINKFKSSETKSKKALWIALGIGNILGAINSAKKLSDSLLLPDNCDELEEE